MRHCNHYTARGLYKAAQREYTATKRLHQLGSASDYQLQAAKDRRDGARRDLLFTMQPDRSTSGVGWPE